MNLIFQYSPPASFDIIQFGISWIDVPGQGLVLPGWISWAAPGISGVDVIGRKGVSQGRGWYFGGGYPGAGSGISDVDILLEGSEIPTCVGLHQPVEGFSSATW